ncbi:MAG: RNA polymerase sigma factor [Chitinophagaceae bacterium]
MSRFLSPDQLLIDRISLNDTEAFEKIYHLYWKSLYLYCLKKIESSEDAKIIVRSIFTDIWEKRHSLPVSFCLSKHLYQEVRKKVIKCISEKLAGQETRTSIEERLKVEFSVLSLQAARKPVSKSFTIINRPSELIRQQTGQAGTEHHNTFETLRCMFQSLTDKFSFTNLLSYSKN